MQLTEQYLIRLRNSLQEHELEQGEILRVLGLGEHYIALACTKVEDPPYTELYTMVIDGVEYILYARHHAGPSQG